MRVRESKDGREVMNELAEMMGQEMIHLYEKLAAAMRWQIAQILDKFSDVCWARAALWAIFPEHHPFSEVFELRDTVGWCEGSLPYCGKCMVLAGRNEA